MTREFQICLCCLDKNTNGGKRTKQNKNSLLMCWTIDHVPTYSYLSLPTNQTSVLYIRGPNSAFCVKVLTYLAMFNTAGLFLWTPGLYLTSPGNWMLFITHNDMLSENMVRKYRTRHKTEKKTKFKECNKHISTKFYKNILSAIFNLNIIKYFSVC